MENLISTDNNALQKMLSLKLKMLIESDLKNFRVLKTAQTVPANAKRLIAA